MPTHDIKISGRKEIKFSDIDFSFGSSITEPKHPTMELRKISNDAYGFPEDANLFLRMWRGREQLVFKCGTVASVTPPPKIELEKFKVDDFQYEFRVVSLKKNSTLGKILGSTKRGRQVVSDANLDDNGMVCFRFNQAIAPYLWKMEFDDDYGPEISVDESLPNPKDYFQSAAVQALIMPTIVKEILSAVYSDGERDSFSSKWKEKWHEWAVEMNETDIPSSGEKPDEWIERTVELFLGSKSFLKDLIETLSENDE